MGVDLGDVFPRWRDRLRPSRDEPSKDAGQYLVNLLCDPDTRTKMYRVYASGEEIPDTVCFPKGELWQGRLVRVPDPDGGDDLEVNYEGWDPYLEYYDPNGHWEFDVRRRDSKRWECLYPELAAPAPQTTAGAEKQAIAHLTPLLKTCRNAISKADAWEECSQFKISYDGFNNRVWPAARVSAGLEQKAPAGRKRRKPPEQIIGPEPGRKSRRKSRS